MELSDKPAAQRRIGERQGRRIWRPSRGVVRRHLQLRAGQRSEIIASGVYADLPVLMCESGQLCGQTYNQAQAFLRSSRSPSPMAGSAWSWCPNCSTTSRGSDGWADQGMMRLEASRPKRTFDDLTLPAELRPGAMLVLSSLSNRPGSLGHHFFTEEQDEGRLEQKLLLDTALADAARRAVQPAGTAQTGRIACEQPRGQGAHRELIRTRTISGRFAQAQAVL